MSQFASRALVFLSSIVTVSSVHAGAFIFASDANGIDSITYPPNYSGAGGLVQVNICFDNTSVNVTEAAQSLANVVKTWNDMLPQTPNVLTQPHNNVPVSSYDFESVLLHELGHCLGLAHPNEASESGLPYQDWNYTKSLPGPNGVRDLNAGADGLIGSNDDQRNDDVNLHWFRILDNSPFNFDSFVDGTTMSRELSQLPVGHSFSENADRTIGSVRGFGTCIGNSSGKCTEAVMQQGTLNGEAQRSLQADDVQTRLLADSGVDRTAGTADDFIVQVNNLGARAPDDPSCDLVIDFDSSKTGFAVCQVSGTGISSNPKAWAITSGSLYFEPNVNWYFNDVSNVQDADSDGIEDVLDNCPATPNTDQANFDGDSQGDACDDDDDNDGMPDAYEETYFFNPKDPSDAAKDQDGDGLSNLTEYTLNTLPVDTDSDGDKLHDGIDYLPIDASNTCGGVNVLFATTTIGAGEVLQCGASASIEMADSINIAVDGRVDLYAPQVSLQRGVAIPLGAVLRIGAINPEVP